MRILGAMNGKVCAFLLAVVSAVLLIIPLGAAPMAMAETEVAVTLEGTDYRTTVHPAPLPRGTGSYRDYFEELWAASLDLGKCLNALAPSLGDGVLALIAPLETLPQDAEVVVDAKGVTVLPDRGGRGFDRHLLGAALADCLDGKPSISLSLMPLRAEVTREELTLRTALIGCFVTYYDVNNVNRAHNLALAAGSLNAYVLPSGERLSFNEVVGPRTAEQGYRPAPVIQDGDYTEGLGGGVCQVSTTLYNAVLRAGLKVEVSHPHSLRAHYVGPGWDAMVSGWSDLVVLNDTPYPVYLFAEAQGGALTVKVLGSKVGEVKLWSDQLETTPAPCEDEEGNPLSSTDGYVLLRVGEEGVKVATYRSIDGVKERLRASNYPAKPSVWTKPKAE